VSARKVTRVDVFKSDERVGELHRTRHGASFVYSPDYAERYRDDLRRAVAFALPVRAAPYEVFGTNLHPFFAGLLPEGLRLRALVRAAKTSEDDLFTLLVAAGADTVGDVSVAAPGTKPRDHTPVADLAKVGSLSFDQLLEESLRYGEGRQEATVAGVQPKLSAAMISVPIRSKDQRRAFILKLNPPEYPRLCENEAFFMALAKRAGLAVASTKLVHDGAGRTGLLVERFDRVPRAGGWERIHQEDACQLLERYPADKYRLSLAEVASALDVCSAPIPNRLKLLRLQAYSYLIANGDLHAKNVSVQETLGSIALTPAYDLVSTLPYGDKSMALSMEGRDARLKAAHFVALGERVGVRRAAVEQMLRALVSKVHAGLSELHTIGLVARKETHLAQVMTQRMKDLTP